MADLRQRAEAAHDSADQEVVASTAAAPPAHQDGSFMDALFSSLFQPGLNAPLHNVMNFTFYALFVSLTALAVLTSGNVHVVALLTIAFGLWASVNWFLAELKKLPTSQFQIQTPPPASMAQPSSQESGAEKEKTS